MLWRLRSDVRLGVAGLLAAIGPVFGLQALLTQWFKSEHPLVTMLDKHPDDSTLLLATTTAVIVAPLAEEFFFRVLFQGWLEKRERVWQRTWGFTRAGRAERGRSCSARWSSRCCIGAMAPTRSRCSFWPSSWAICTKARTASGRRWLCTPVSTPSA